MRHQLILLAMIAGATILPGCAQMGAASQSLVRPDQQPTTNSEKPIGKIVCLWEPAKGVGSDGKPSRGFVGQVLFFTPTSRQPVLVDGDVEIYTFDDQGTPAEQSRPIKKFAFTSDEWNQLSSDSAVGPGYNVTVPYLKAHSFETVCALRLKFTPRSGSVVYSALDSVTLRGKNNPNGLFATKTRSTGTVQELLEENLGKLGGTATGEQQVAGIDSDNLRVGATTIQRTGKGDGKLEALTIHTEVNRPKLRPPVRPPSAGRPTANRKRFRLGTAG